MTREDHGAILSPADIAKQVAPTASLENPRLTEAVEKFLADLEAGTSPSRKEYLAQYADIADELAS